MFTGEEISEEDLILDLNIPFPVYIILFFLLIIFILIKYYFGTEEIFDFIEKAKKKSLKFYEDESEKLLLLTKLNTKINRDFLENSKYYYETGKKKIYGNKKSDSININNSVNNNRNKINIKISKKEENINLTKKKCKKVEFSDNIIYDF